jgi:hypothetical protein
MEGGRWDSAGGIWPGGFGRGEAAGGRWGVGVWAEGWMGGGFLLWGGWDIRWG